jgi:ABC-type Fe3+-hydroxamate transport system substrate-binding protein
MRRWRATLALLGTALLGTALLGTALLAATAPERIASFSPGATRTLVDFGATDKIVAATRWCPLPATHPAARDGDVFNPDLERLLRARPDLVILPRTSNPLWAERCRGAGLKVLVLNPEGAQSVLQDTRLIGETLGRSAEAIDQLTRPLEGIPAQPPRKLLIVWDGMMAGPDSYLAVVMRSAGFKPALANGSWVKLDWESVAHADPEAILWVDSLASDGPIVFAQKRQAEMSQVSVIKGLKLMEAGLIFRTPSGSQWLPGSGLVQVVPKLRELRAKLK